MRLQHDDRHDTDRTRRYPQGTRATPTGELSATWTDYVMPCFASTGSAVRYDNEI